MTARLDRDEVFLETTRSICPVCKSVIDAEVNVRAGKVILRKRCRDHGTFEALLSSDADMYMNALRFNKPGTIPLETQTEVRDGCPLDCGLCPDHKQHTCLGIIEVNSNCNLDCPVCFAESGHQPDGFSLTHDQVASALAAFVRAEGEPEVVMFSGGEPTIHPHILDFLQMAAEAGVRHVMLNTNGIRLARDRRFVASLARLDPKPSIYLQFDGLEAQTHRQLRGKDLREDKRLALEHCAEHGLTVALVMAVERDVNEHEVGAVLRYGVEHPAVRSVVYQPVTHTGRHLEFDPLQRLTNPDVIKSVAAQVPEWLRVSDFFPVPCCFPTCRSVTYLLADGDLVVPVPRLIDLSEHLDYISNRVFPSLDVRSSLERLWSASATPGTSSTADALACAVCAVHVPAEITAKAFMVVVQDFQDPYTFNVKQVMKCCIEQLTPDGRLIPFCAYNSVGYREQIREQLSGLPVPNTVPNAAGLQPILQISRLGSKTTRVGASKSVQTNTGRTLR